MHNDQLRLFRRSTRVFPATAYARHTPSVGCSVTTDPRSTSHVASSGATNRTSAVKILGLFCTKAPSCTSSPDTTPNGSSRSLATAHPPTVPRKRTREDYVDTENTSPPARASSASAEPPRGVQRRSETPDTDDFHVPAEPSHEPSRVASSAAVKGKAEDHSTDANMPQRVETEVASSDTPEPAPTASLYARVQYDKAVIATLPIEVMRMLHPQVLIDYLLSMSVWA
ncbi:hypothetical protein JKF63_03685 [Porcisia hertigi]|uniref:Uncharacterized protein n=1 Tax=Porcisia hertigi TaxID=2761500 RepID=A0A836IQG8_9TRYP|nr:hypothetical protein JKF63_03685 [Porcisia hertigi]